jgi:hypothetical protein
MSAISAILLARFLLSGFPQRHPPERKPGQPPWEIYESFCMYFLNYFIIIFFNSAPEAALT